MKEFWRIIKLIFAWIIGSAGVIIGLVVIFDANTWIQRIFTGLFILISLYIIPKINNWIRLGIRPKFIAIAFLVSFLGMVFTDSIKPSSETEISEADSVEQYYVTASKLNVRKGSGTNHDVVYKLNKGDRVEIISQTNDWTEIKTSQGQGYVSSKYISTEKPESSETPEWLTYLIIGAIVLYGLFSKKGSSGSGGSSKPRSSSPSRPSISKPQPIKKAMSDVRVKSNNYLETFDETGKRINGAFLGGNDEKLLGFTSTFYVTVKSNNYLTTYNSECKRINGMFLGGNDERFHSCAGNTFSTMKSIKYLTNYDSNCKRQSGRFI